MGIKGVYKEIGPGQRIALSKLAVETYEQKGRPLRLAIDISIWLFQIQSGKGGTNPALRTFYYRLLRLITLSIHPLFVFDGPNKPPFKRNKRTGPNVASIPDFLAKQLLKQFGLPIHLAPGEAEAECALLQRKGIVDAVLSEDVDTLMFGSGLTLRNWSAEGTTSAQTPTHVNLYDALKTRESAGLDSEGMILVALMSGGDYIPEGIPGCGPKTACLAARAGFGRDLCAIAQDDDNSLQSWKERLKHELYTNESKHFQRRSMALVIPADFPRRDILRYYTHPCVSSDARLEKLSESLRWDQEIDIGSLRIFTAEAFEWICLGGAKKFIRNLAPALLVRQLRLRGDAGDGLESDDTAIVATREAKLVKNIHARRNHITTDGMPELRVDYIPHALVPIDLDAEDPDPELPLDGLQSEDEAIPDIDGADEGGPSSPRRKRGPSTYDPTKLERIWIAETYVRVGVPLKVQDWEESFRNAQKYEAMKAQRKRLAAVRKSLKKVKDRMPYGALDAFTKTTKPARGTHMAKTKDVDTAITEDASIGSIALNKDVPQGELTCKLYSRPTSKGASTTTSRPFDISHMHSINLVSSSPRQASPEPTLGRAHLESTTFTSTRTVPQVQVIRPVRGHLETSPEPLLQLPASVTKRRKRSPLRRAHTIANTYALKDVPTLSSPRKRPSTSMSSAAGIFNLSSPGPAERQGQTTPSKSKAWATEVISLASSPTSAMPSTPSHRQRFMTQYLSPSPHKPNNSRIPLNGSHSRIQSPQSRSSVSQTLEEDPFLDQQQADAGSGTHTNAFELEPREPNKCRGRTPLAVSSSSDINTASMSSQAKYDASKAAKSIPADFKVPAFRLPPKVLSSPPTQERAEKIGNGTAGKHIDEYSYPPLGDSEDSPQRNEISPMGALLPKTIRLRESLVGTWAFDAEPSNSGPCASSAVGDEHESVQKKRKSLGTESPVRTRRGKEKRWRVSRVEVLDLTGL